MNTEKRSLLLVDRCSTYLSYMGRLFNRLNYSVHSATTAEDALNAMTERPHSVVLTDTALPRMSGIDLLKRMKQDSRLLATPVIIHSSDGGPSVETSCVQEGCAAYFNKPADPDVLYRAIQTAIETAPRQHIRIDTLLRVKVGAKATAGGAAKANYVTALSEGGLYIKTLTPERLHAVVPLTILIHDRKVRVKAEVLYNSTKLEGRQLAPGMGLKFVDISPEDAAFVRQFIREQLEKGPSVKQAGA